MSNRFTAMDLAAANKECSSRDKIYFDDCPRCEMRLGIHCRLCEIAVTGCVAADSIVSSLGFWAGTKTLWFGNLITIRLASGKQLTGTPDHHVLTDRGWVALEFLCRGDHVITTPFVNNDLIVSDKKPYVEARPTKISEVYDALPDSLKSQRIHGLGVDFDSKFISYPNINVVDAYSLLGDRIEAFLNKPALYLSLASTDTLREIALLALRDPLLKLCATHAATASSIGGGNLTTTSNTIEIEVSDSLSILHSTNLDPSSDESRTNTCPCYFESLTQRPLGFAFSVSTDEIININIVPKVPTGHVVYDLSAEEGWYSVNEVIVHNCFCTETDRFGKNEAIKRLIDRLGLDAAKAKLQKNGFWTPPDAGTE